MISSSLMTVFGFFSIIINSRGFSISSSPQHVLYGLQTKKFIRFFSFTQKHLCKTCQNIEQPRHSLVTRLNNNSNLKYSSNISTPSENHLYEEWTLEQDKFLFENRKDSIPKLASILGRGLGGVQSRLQKLTDVDSSAYARLFVDTKQRTFSEVSNITKQQSLVPALEVLRRIRWDAALTPCDFSVLHYDRVEDCVFESNFEAPNTNVEGREELFVFAIPEHRIKAIKYKERLIWDKEKRIDCVFGSMNGHGERIETVLETYNDWKKKKDEEKERNRLHQIHVTKIIKSMLGEDSFNILKGRSSFLMDAKEINFEFNREVKSYVKFALNTFKDANKKIKQDESLSEEKSFQFATDMTKSQLEVKFMFFFSELVALFPQEEVRKCVLIEIASVIAELEGNKSKKGSALPELHEEDLSEKFVKGSGAGGQKLNKTSNKVVLLHIPTNLRVECQDTRSLNQNRKIARKKLQLKLDEYINGDQSRISLKAEKAVKNKSRRKSRNKARRNKRKEA